jgi:hypothetical protein
MHPLLILMLMHMNITFTPATGTDKRETLLWLAGPGRGLRQTPIRIKDLEPLPEKFHFG